VSAPSIMNRSVRDSDGPATSRPLGWPTLLHPQGHDNPLRGGRHGLAAAAGRRCLWVTRDGQHTAKGAVVLVDCHESPAPGPVANMGDQRERQDATERQHQGDHHHPDNLHRLPPPFTGAADSGEPADGWQLPHGPLVTGHGRPTSHDSTSWPCRRPRARRCNRDTCICEKPTRAAIVS